VLDYHVILDLMPTVASLYFQKRLSARSSGDGEQEEVKLTAVQSAILLAVGLQRKTVEDVEVRFFM
jgi:N-acetyltransferase 10